MSMKRWVSFGRTESGDDLTPIIWDTKPSAQNVDDAYEALYPQEYAEVGHVNWTVAEAEEAILVP